MKPILFSLTLLAAALLIYVVVIQEHETPSNTVSVESPQQQTSDPTPTRNLAKHLHPHNHGHVHDPAHEHNVSDEKPVQQVLSPEMKQAVNDLLRPPGKTYEAVETKDGIEINLHGRAGSVAVATIDDAGNILIKDYTSPVK